VFGRKNLINGKRPSGEKNELKENGPSTIIMNRRRAAHADRHDSLYKQIYGEKTISEISKAFRKGVIF